MRGLSNKEVLDRIKNKQINKCEDNDKNISGILIKNIFTFFNLLNFILFILVLFTAKPLNSLFIIVILLNTIIAIKTELSARKKLKSLKLLADNKYSVLREGKIISLNKEEIVKDDLIELKSGDQIVVDGPIIKGELIINEANISGESDDIYKYTDDYLYSGSYVIAGKAFQKASTIGSESFVNKMLAKSKQFKHNKSNLLKDLNKILKFVTIFIVPLGILIFLKAQYLLNNFASALLQSSAAMIGMIPEGLILLSSVSLMASSINLAKKQILVNDLYSLENLAKCDVICLDKTGTLTNGKMSVKDVIYYKDKDFIDNIIANFNKHFSDQNQTAKALNDYFKLSFKLEIEDSLVFNSKNKYSMIKCNDEYFYLGAYDFIPIKNKMHDMTVSKLASEGYRILTLASSKEILAFILLTDELRANIKEIINYLSDSDVKCIVISGDDPIMVNQIAKSVGIDTQDN